METEVNERFFVMGDIHGAYRALQQCLQRSSFDYKNDHLIFLGDVSDGWPETNQCIEELLKIDNLTFLLGNHDWWTLQWMMTGRAEEVWLSQGGEATIKSYAKGMVPERHTTLFEKASLYHILENRLFVHAGISPDIPLQHQSIKTFLWDREIAHRALDNLRTGKSERITSYDEVYLGHTPIPYNKPQQSGEVWLMDTGAGWSGVLSMMDLHSKEMFISDAVPSLYPGVEGRKKKR